MKPNIEQIIDQYLSDIIEDQCMDVMRFFMEPIEQMLVTKVLEKTNGNQTKAAKILGISRSTLHQKVKLIEQRTKNSV